MSFANFGKGEIYRIWFANDPDGKSYVGQTVQGTKTRILQHVRDAYGDGTGCPLLDQATRDFGTKNMRYEILEDGIETHEELDEAEKFWISEFNSVKPNGYNVKKGGQGNHDGKVGFDFKDVIADTAISYATRRIVGFGVPGMVVSALLRSRIR